MFSEMLLIARHYPLHIWSEDMAGNVTLYEVNTEGVAGMLEGKLSSQPVKTLSNIIAITFIGKRPLPTDWLSWMFQVQRSAMHEALQWLQTNNELYQGIAICPRQLATLPEDNILIEVMAWYTMSTMKAWPFKSARVITDEMGKRLYTCDDDPPLTLVGTGASAGHL